MNETRNVQEIVWRENLYPRFEQFYIEIPPIGHIVIGEKIHLTLGSATCGNCPDALSSLYAGYIQAGIIYLIGSVAKHFYLAYRDSMKGNIEKESDIRDNIAKRLKVQGWIIATEDHTSQGRIDVLARKGEEVKIIEVKQRADSNSAAHALGQLLFYSKFYPEATLWFHSPERPTPTVMSILNSFDVQYLEVS